MMVDLLDVVISEEEEEEKNGVNTVGILCGSLLQRHAAVFPQLKPQLLNVLPNVRVQVYVGQFQQTLRVVYINRHLCCVDSSNGQSYTQPSDICFEAIGRAFALLRCDFVLGLYSVGSLKTGVKPSTLMFPHDFWNVFNIKRIAKDPSAHIIPTINPRLRQLLLDIVKSSSTTLTIQDGGVYVQSSGPRFETKAEIQFFSQIGDVIGMTGAHECETMGELRIPFAMMAMVDNYANGIIGDLHIHNLKDEKTRNDKSMIDAVTLILTHLQSKQQPDSIVSNNDTKIPVDLIIASKYIVPVEPLNSQILENYSLVVNNGVIMEILPSDAATEKYSPVEFSDMGNHVLIPGLINAHTHASMTLLRGLADDKPLCDWLVEDIWPAEQKFVSPEFVRDGTLHSASEMIRSGTTCFNDMYFYPLESAAVLEKIGMRGVIGQIMMEFPTQYGTGPDDYLKKAREVTAEFDKNFKFVKSSVAPHAPYTVSDNSFLEVEKLSKALNLPIHLHLHETEAECRDSELLDAKSMNCHKSDQACRPIKNLKRLGLLSDRLIAVHMTQLTDEEIKDVAEAKCNIVHCPSSNLKLASGVCRVADLVDSNVNVAIGTDGASSNNTLNMFAEMKLAAILAKGHSKKCTTLPAALALQMATLNGAKALGLDKEIGSLTVGKWADVVAVSLDSIEMMPMYNVISHLVYVAGRENVSDVWIGGKRVLRNRRLCTIDENEVKDSCKKWHHQIKDYHDSLSKSK